MEEFEGFSAEAVRFLARLKRNNKREWFVANRAAYDAAIFGPARAFVAAVGEHTELFAPSLKVVPKVGGSIFRINRDTRFSADKTPYKAQVAFAFWEGRFPRATAPTMYFHFTSKEVLVGGGCYNFDKDQLKRYRAAVDDEKTGRELVAILKSLTGKGKYEIGGEALKRVPPGFAKDHKRADLLKRRGIFLFVESPIPKAMHGAAWAGVCATHFRKLMPFHRWLSNAIKPPQSSQLHGGFFR